MWKSLILCAAFVSLGATRNPFPEFLMEPREEVSNDIDGTSVGRVVTAPLDTLGELTCQMDVKISKQVLGKCVRLGPGSDACVAGSYVHPFHHECLFAN